MRPTRKHALVLLLLLLPLPSFSRGGGEDTTRSVPRSAITIQTVPDSGQVYIDDVRVGATPVSVDTLQPGVHRLLIVHPDPANWLTGNIHDSLEVTAGQSRAYRFVFPSKFSIESVPSGADVWRGNDLLGVTPLVLPEDSLPAGSTLLLRREGFRQTAASPDTARRGSLMVTLPREWTAGEPDDSPFATSSVLKRSPVRLYLSGAATVIAGTLAAYLKIKADDRQDTYLLTGSPALIAERNRLDTGAAISLAVTQVSFSLFAYFLLNE